METVEEVNSDETKVPVEFIIRLRRIIVKYIKVVNISQYRNV